MNKPVHSKVGASSMHRWAACPGSVRLCSGIESKSSVYAEEGTKAHELAAHWLQRGMAPAFPNAEMESAVTAYVVHVRGLIGPGDACDFERGFHLKKLHPDLYGTADAVVWKSKEKHLHVIDYKHGAGVAVDVNDNEQLRYYALGALLELGYPAEKVTTSIVQPRCPHEDGPIRSETFDAFDLLEWAADLVDAVKRTEAPDAPLVPGDHCRWCAASAVCPALHEKATEMAKLEFRQELTYDPVKLKAALDAREAIKAWVKALDEFAYNEAMHGRCPPGYKLVEKRANRKWRSDKDAEHTFGDQFSDDIYEPRTIKSPAQVEKIIGKTEFARFEHLAVKESSGFTLAPETDKRQAIKLDAASEFANV